MSEIKVNSIKGVGASAAAITANITNKPNRNLIINGAMQVAQRGTSSTSNGYGTVDRFKAFYGGQDEAPTQAQADVASGTTPYTLGFRKSYKITNGNQTSGADASDYSWIVTVLEAQDIANSGWNYTSASSYVTLSFWVKSSVAQDFKGYLKTQDGTRKSYAYATGSLTADTWTKVTKTISGNSDLQFDNDSNAGLEINILPFMGTTYTNNSATEDVWATYDSAARMKDSPTSWWTTNNATFEITGVQLEVGSVATDFEHRSFGQELALCQRYFYQYVDGSEYTSGIASLCNVIAYQDNNVFGTVEFPVTMRAKPTLVHVEGTNYFKIYRNAGSGDLNALQLQASGKNGANINAYSATSGVSISQDQGGFMLSNDTGVRVGFLAEL